MHRRSTLGKIAEFKFCAVRTGEGGIAVGGGVRKSLNRDRRA